MLVWFHGGGWMLGDLDGFDRVARGLANASGCVLLSVDYRLAPEHPFPAAIEDADAVIAWVAGPGAAGLGVDPGRVAVGGDSSGGQIAAVAALHARSLIRATSCRDGVVPTGGCNATPRWDIVSVCAPYGGDRVRRTTPATRGTTETARRGGRAVSEEEKVQQHLFGRVTSIALPGPGR